jgi:hypothetical protein
LFSIAVALYIFSSCQVYATSIFEEEGYESRQRNYSEFIDFNRSDDAIWFSVMAATSPPALEVDVTTLDFGETDTSKPFSVTNSGDGTLVWSLYEYEEWISVDATSGILGGSESTTVTVYVDRSKVVEVGEVDGLITITSNGGNAEIDVTMTVPDDPVLEVNPSALDFSSEYVVKGLSIINSGTGVLNWEIAAQETWITVDQETGVTGEGATDKINVMVDRSAVTELRGYSGELDITSNGGDVTVSVVMKKVNHAPEIPAVISPADGAVSQSLYTTLSWEGGDIDAEDGDVITYDVYFSTNEILVDIEDVSVLTCSDMKVCYCEPGANSLDGETTYYWKVVAKDSYGEINSGSVWSFTTKNTISLCPAFAIELDNEERYLLRELRDKVLTKNENGRNYINVYYRYSWELLLILFINDELGMETVGVFKKLFPAINNLLVGREAFVTAKNVEEARKLLGRVALYAGPQLKIVLKSIQVDIKNREKMETFGIIVTDE